MSRHGYKPFQNEEESQENGENVANRATMVAPGQPMNTSGQPMMASGQPMNTSVQPMNTSGQAMNTSGQAMNTSGLMNTSGQPMMAPGQPMNTSDPPMMASGQSMNTYSQPMMAPGQQMNAFGQPVNAYGQPMMAPGRQMLGPGQYGYDADVLGQQPDTQMQLMPPPSAVPGCPPGLEYMVQLDQLLVHQQVELAEMLTNIHFENKYVIKNSLGQQVYFAREQSDNCQRACCGASRGFILTITDNMEQEVIRIIRHFKCCAGWTCCACASSFCSQFIEVESPPGTVIGYIRQTASFLSPHFDVRDANDECVLKIHGPCCRCQEAYCTADIDFTIFTKDMADEIGKVSKQWSGYLKEMLTAADNFGVQFPADLDVRTKAVLLASTFLIDFMFFEHKPNVNAHHH